MGYSNTYIDHMEEVKGQANNLSDILQKLMEDIIEEHQGITEATSSAKGILSTVEKFSFLFGVVVSELSSA